MVIKRLKVILIHGNSGGTGEDYWFPYVKRELEKLGLKVITKTFPDNDIGREKYWMPFLKKMNPDENTILIGWSSGAELAMRYAEKDKLLGSVLISPCYTDLNDKKEKLSGYFSRPWNWNAIRKNQKWIMQFYSLDDPYIPIHEAEYIHVNLKTEYHHFTDQKHFFPKKEFPEIVEAIQSKLK